ncbi:hypothetical protein [Qipengyuania sp. NPDC077563]|uniref:hypothetical protein n=1 Tax=Qipengyuania sp. NPDC077563 TaxID=3364497 RepID=UPI00384B6E0F
MARSLNPSLRAKRGNPQGALFTRGGTMDCRAALAMTWFLNDVLRMKGHWIGLMQETGNCCPTFAHHEGHDAPLPVIASVAK